VTTRPGEPSRSPASLHSSRADRGTAGSYPSCKRSNPSAHEFDDTRASILRAKENEAEKWASYLGRLPHPFADAEPGLFAELCSRSKRKQKQSRDCKELACGTLAQMPSRFCSPTSVQGTSKTKQPKDCKIDLIFAYCTSHHRQKVETARAPSEGLTAAPNRTGRQHAPSVSKCRLAHANLKARATRARTRRRSD
jgi:hypothetical protein